MPHDFDRVVDRRRSDSNKWHKFGPDVLPLWVADMDFVSPEPVVRALRIVRQAASALGGQLNLARATAEDAELTATQPGQTQDVTRTFTVALNAARATNTDKTRLYFSAVKASAVVNRINADTAQAVFDIVAEYP